MDTSSDCGRDAFAFMKHVWDYDMKNVEITRRSQEQAATEQTIINHELIDSIPTFVVDADHNLHDHLSVGVMPKPQNQNRYYVPMRVLGFKNVMFIFNINLYLGI